MRGVTGNGSLNVQRFQAKKGRGGGQQSPPKDSSHMTELSHLKRSNSL